MTGFGECRRQTEGLAVAVEIRTINSRHFKLSYRASEGYAALEPEIEAATREVIRRGTVQLNLRVDRAAEVDDYRINTACWRATAGSSRDTPAGRNGPTQTI